MDIGNSGSQSGESSSGGFSPKSGGRIFKAGEEEAAPKINLDEEIEKNIRIRTMPKNKNRPAEKQGSQQDKNKAVGVIIMIVGILVLVAAVYLAYTFLIKPQASNPINNFAPVNKAVDQNSAPKNSEAGNKASAPAVKNNETPTPIAVASSTSPSTSSGAAAVPAASQPVSINTAATSTAPIAGTPAGAKIVSGLSVVEKVLFGVDSEKIDSDGDGYSNQSEIINLYNPAGTGKITDNQHIGAYQNASNKYSIAYPKNWKIQSLENGDTLIFTAADNSLIGVATQLNLQKQTVKEWYNGQFPDAPAVDADITARDGWQGIFQEDKLIFYLVDSAKDKIHTISYVPAAENDLSYYNVFLMMINSFTVK